MPVCLAGTSSDKLESFFGHSQYELSREHAALLLAVELNFYDFVKDFDIAGFNTLQISQHPDATERRNLLFHAIEQPMIRSIDSCFESWWFSSEMIETLLDSGCDPNQVIVRQEDEEWDKITTPWHVWLSRLGDNRYWYRFRGVGLGLKASFITAKMLEAGADLHPKISTSRSDSRAYLLENVLDWIQVSQEAESKQLRLPVLQSCIAICKAIYSRTNENPTRIDNEDPDKLKEVCLRILELLEQCVQIEMKIS